jgi:hypothetical protein
MSNNPREFIKEFRAKQKHLMGDIDVLSTLDGRSIDLNNMTDEEAAEAADIFMGIGNPTRLGAMGK